MKKNIFIITFLLVTGCISFSFKATKAITFTHDVLPLVQLKCSPCHLRSKGGKKTNLEHYKTAKKYAAAMLARIQLNPKKKDFMPSKNEKLKEEEIAVFKKWLDDGLLE